MSLLSRLPPALAARIPPLRDAFEQIDSLAAFVSAFDAAVALSADLDEATQDLGAADCATLAPLLPGLAAEHIGEWPHPVWVLDAAAWRERARRTPERDDDAFLDLMDLAYTNPAGVGTPRWLWWTWDHGGFSRLGSGIYLQILQGAEQLLLDRTPFAVRVQALREQIIGDLLAEEGGYPFCDPATGEPTSLDALNAEAQEILDTVSLSMAQRLHLAARMSAGFPYDALLP